MLNLVTDDWIPIRRTGADGATVVAPWQLAAEDIVGFDWDRADFGISCRELVIGLLQLAFPPRDEREWHRRWCSPRQEDWREALDRWAGCFELGGPDARFMQDAEPFEDTAPQSRLRPASALFMDSPGQGALKRNTDLFVSRRQDGPLATGTAAMALFTLQSWACAGGGGHFVSLRGGGPLSTLVMPELPTGEGHRLARELWANVLPMPALPPAEAPSALPWLRNRTGPEGATRVSPRDAHPLEAWFAMPRRLRLAGFDAQAGTVGHCCQVPYGTQYVGWRHPFSPQRRLRPEDSWRTVRSHPSGPEMCNFLVWSLPARQDGRFRPAPAVEAFRSRGLPYRILAGGWAMDRAKPLNFVCGLVPGISSVAASDPEREGRLHRLAGMAELLANELRSACGAEADILVEEFVRKTSDEFRAAFAAIEAGGGGREAAAWIRAGRDAALALAEVAAPRNVDCRERVATAFRRAGARQPDPVN